MNLITETKRNAFRYLDDWFFEKKGGKNNYLAYIPCEMSCVGGHECLAIYHHRRKCNTAQQNAKNSSTPPQNIHLSCFARLETMRIVSPLTPSVFATLYSLRCVPFSISRCWPRSPSTARPRSRYSSSCALVLVMKFCSRRACVSRV